jgi:two-component system, OmpR family, copper resistance phosphate regulon response regulator CusR
MKILIVEDEPKVGSFINRELDETGYETTIAYDGFIAFRMMRQDEFNMIVLDVNLPSKNGFEVCREIRSFKGYIPSIDAHCFGSHRR